MNTRDFDVLVIGGGLAGLAFAALLRHGVAGIRDGLTIAVVEAGKPPPDGLAAEAGLRVLALSPGSRGVLETCGAWNDLTGGRLQPYRRMLVWHHLGAPQGARSITFDAADEGIAELGHIAEADVVRRAQWRRLAADASAKLIAGSAPAALDLRRQRVELRMADGVRLRARLIVGADGPESWLRRAAGVAHSSRPYRQRALVAHVASERPHAETAWQRFLPGGPLALLPLADGRCSIVWSCPDARAHDLVEASEPAFNRALTEASGTALGELRLTTRRLSFPLASGQASQYTGLRFALIGDAAHRVHPLAGQGANLGFQDAAALAQTLASHLRSPRADPGDPLALRRYERWRKAANLSTLVAMDVLHGLFTSRVAGVAEAAGIGLGVVDRLPGLKSRLADYAIGRRGDLPRASRRALN